MNENNIFQKIFYATGCVFELARGVIIFAVVLALVNVFVVTINVVNGQSMEPNFHNAQFVLIDKFSYFQRTPKRGEAVVIRFPGDPEKVRYIKRVIGLPGEVLEIRDSVVYINGVALKEPYLAANTITSPDKIVQIPANQYFLMGDNRENSNDSRVFGPIERRFLVGLAYYIAFPLRDAGLVPPQFYNVDITTGNPSFVK
jgi:signal peptidase I